MTLAELDTQTTTFTAAELYQALLDGRDMVVLDVRNETDFQRWRVEGRADLPVINIPYYAFLEDEEASVAQTPLDRPIYVVCAKEGSAQFVADVLHTHGRQVAYLAGGIVSWGRFYDFRDVINEPFGRIVQIARPARGDLSFLIISQGQAAVIDPLRHIEHYLDVLQMAGAHLTHILDTHGHADHISGGTALAQATGAPYFLHPYDAIHPIDMLPARLAFHYLADGQTFQVGAFSVKVIWFPGHTLGQVNFLFTAPSGESYLFTGDGLFLRSFGRPDLGGQGEAWTPILYHSLFERLPREIQPQTLILPAHFSTLDEEGLAPGVFAQTYGEIQTHNDALHPRSLEAFTAYVLGNLPVFPPEYVVIKRVNAGLVTPDEEQASELELGKNICALEN